MSTFSTGQTPTPDDYPSQPPEDERKAEEAAAAKALKAEQERLAEGSTYVVPETPTPVNPQHTHEDASSRKAKG